MISGSTSTASTPDTNIHPAKPQQFRLHLPTYHHLSFKRTLQVSHQLHQPSSLTHILTREIATSENVPIRKYPLWLRSRRSPSDQALPLCPQRPKPSMLRRLVCQEGVVESYRVLPQLCILCQTEGIRSCSLRDFGVCLDGTRRIWNRIGPRGHRACWLRAYNE